MTDPTLRFYINNWRRLREYCFDNIFCLSILYLNFLVTLKNIKIYFIRGKCRYKFTKLIIKIEYLIKKI